MIDKYLAEKRNDVGTKRAEQSCVKLKLSDKKLDLEHQQKMKELEVREKERLREIEIHEKEAKNQNLFLRYLTAAALQTCQMVGIKQL